MKSVVFTLVFIVGFAKSSAPNSSSFHDPELELMWQESGRVGWLYEGEDIHRGVRVHDQQIVVSSWVSILLIICSANYPVYWDYDNNKELSSTDSQISPPITVLIRRAAENFTDPNSYLYYSYLRLRGDGRRITGSYTCKSENDDKLKKERYIFWESTTRNLIYGELTDPYYTSSTCNTNACKDRPTRTVMADKLNRTIILPCSVCNPELRVQLFKKNVTTGLYDEISVNAEHPSIKYDARLGFILNVPDVPSLYGIYKCTIKSLLSSFRFESIIVNVTNETTNVSDGKIENMLIGKASVDYEKTLVRKIKCCSNGTRPPRIYISVCETKYGCMKVRRELQNFEYFDRTDDRSLNCKSSTLKSYNRFGVFRCFGDGIDITRDFYIPSPHRFYPEIRDFEDEIPSQMQNSSQEKIYYDDEISNIPKSQFITFSSSPLPDDDATSFNVFTNQTISLQCIPSNYFFTYGIRWSLKWKNGTSQVLPETKPNSQLATFLDVGISNVRDFKISDGLESIICHAPLYNSSEWVDKNLKLNITDSIAPTIVGAKSESITWIYGDSNKELSCETSGFPKPTITWVDPWTANEYNYRYVFYTWSSIIANRELIVLNNGVGKIKFRSVIKAMEGNYSCIVTNWAGRAVKTFTVNVTDVPTVPTTTSRPARWVTAFTRLNSTTSTSTTKTTMTTSTESPTTHSTETKSVSSPSSNEEGTNKSSSVWAILFTLISVALVAFTVGLAYLLIKSRKRQRMLGDSNGQDTRLTWSSSQVSYEDIINYDDNHEAAPTN